MAKPKLLIEQWLPIEAIGAECMRERGASSALPPLYFLHVWWARRPLTVSRAAILASLLPAYPSDEDPDARPWPDRFRSLFPNFDSYRAWFIRLIGILGDPVAGRKLIEWAKKENKKLKFNPYGYARAFTINPNEEQLEQLYDLLEWTWGRREITFCDPMSGGGSIPFEALRYGLTVHANELNPVASVILKATLDYPARFGPSVVQDLRKYGRLLAESVRKRLEGYFPLSEPNENVFAYIWARTILCPETGKVVPLSPNWWLKKGTNPVAVQVIANPGEDRCRFEIVRGAAACKRVAPDKGTVRRGTGISPWTGATIDGDFIKAEAQSGRMSGQIYAIANKNSGDFSFRPPNEEDDKAAQQAIKDLKTRWSSFAAQGLIPEEPRKEGRADWACEIYGMKTWADAYSERQLLSHLTIAEELRRLEQTVRSEIERDRADCVLTLLGLAFDKGADRNSNMARWIPQRCVLANTFDRHDFALKWSFGEFDAARNMVSWSVDQIADSILGICKLLTTNETPLLSESGRKPAQLYTGPAQQLRSLSDNSIDCICVDPPYYDNVQYAECSDFFYVWMKRTVGHIHQFNGFVDELAPKDDEAVANFARFKDSGRKRKELASKDYELKMLACFREMNRVLRASGSLTIMFTHKEVDAWDKLGTALISSGFVIDSSWPIHTEFDNSLHQAKKNAAASTILLVCRKREAVSESAWWDDLKGHVKETARETAQRFEKEGIRGVDLYISTFGPVLSIISERWPVLTSNTDSKTGDPIPLQPSEALDLARHEVINLRKQGLLLGRSVEFDPVTDWYLMAWDAFRAQEFPADEARKLALALGLDLEANLVRDKRLITKKGKNVTIALPSARRKKGMVDPESEEFPHLIDALHTAMMVYEEDGSKACQVFIDRHGLRNDSRIKALVQAAMQAIPTTRDKGDKFLRPEMTTLDALRLLVWEDLPAPPEEDVPKIDTQMVMFGKPSDDQAADETDEDLAEDAEDDESEEE